MELTEEGRGVLQHLDALLEGGVQPQGGPTTNGHSTGMLWRPLKVS